MNYYWLYAKDERHVNWILFRADPKRRLRDRYKSLACKSCGRVDEVKAVDCGFDSDVSIRSRLDYFTSDDGFQCVNIRGRKIIEESGALGLKFVPLPKEQHFIVVPTHRVPVKRKILEVHEKQVMDLEAVARDPRLIATARKTIRVEVDSCGMEFQEKCEDCGRYFISLYWPKLSSMSLPEDDSTIVAPDVLFEHTWSSDTLLLASGRITNALRRAGLQGLDPSEAR